MVSLLITSLFVLAILAVAVYFWQKPSIPPEAQALPPAPGRGLFVEGTAEGQALVKAASEQEATTAAAAKQQEIVGRAQAADKSILLEVQDPKLYDEVLNILVDLADSDAKLLSLISYVTRNELRVNKNLAERLINSYKQAPTRNSTATMLHLAALSDEASVYQDAVEAALKAWQEGLFSEISAPELRAILEGEFWILSSTTRRSGAGFLLKRTLANARHKLEAGQHD